MVSVRNLTQVFGAKTVLRDIDLEVAKGEIVAIMGSSGGGKTTLLRCISGLITPTKGEVTVDGINVREEPEEARAHMGMVFQSAALFDYMNVEDNVLFGLRRQRKRIREKPEKLAADALERVNLKDVQHLMPAELSGGMRKRVGIARALAMSPAVMLYDEPTTGLDPITTYTIDNLIVSLRKAYNVTSIVVSHDVSSVFRTADRIAFLDQGQLVFVGDPADFEKSRHAAIQELIEKSRATEFGGVKA